MKYLNNEVTLLELAEVVDDMAQRINALETMVKKFTSTNTGSPKLPCPHLDNVGGCIKTVGHKKCTCNFVNRQLRAGA